MHNCLGATAPKGTTTSTIGVRRSDRLDQSQKSKSARCNAGIGWDALRRISIVVFFHSLGRRVARIVELIAHAKSTNAAHVFPALLNGEEPTICAAATITRLLGAQWIRIVG